MKKMIFVLILSCLAQGAEQVSVSGKSLYQLTSNWTNQDNQLIAFNSLAGRPRIVAMVYTKCKTACPLLIHEIEAIVSRLSSPDLRVDLFSFDSETENASSLQSLKAQYKFNKNWTTYYGSAKAVSELASVFEVQYKKLPSGEYIHSNVIFFLNKEGEVMAKQEGLGGDTAAFIKKVQSLIN